MKQRHCYWLNSFDILLPPLKSTVEHRLTELRIIEVFVNRADYGTLFCFQWPFGHVEH